MSRGMWPLVTPLGVAARRERAAPVRPLHPRPNAMSSASLSEAVHPWSFGTRLRAAVRLSPALNEDVASDPRMSRLAEAAFVVGGAGLARGVGAYAQEGAAGIAGGIAVGVLTWPLAATAVWLVASLLGNRTRSFAALVAVLGFAGAPLVLLALGAIPVPALRTGIWIAAHGLAIAAMVVAVRQVLGVSTTRALAVCAGAVLTGWAFLALLGGFLHLARAAPLESGSELYERYCASCHGVEGDGTGPVAGYLILPPADLRLLSEKYGSPLPKDQLAEYIDGRQNVRAHGPRGMPVWGRELEELPPRRDSEARKLSVIYAILEHIETFQPRPEL